MMLQLKLAVKETFFEDDDETMIYFVEGVAEFLDPVEFAQLPSLFGCHMLFTPVDGLTMFNGFDDEHKGWTTTTIKINENNN